MSIAQAINSMFDEAMDTLPWHIRDEISIMEIIGKE